MHAFTQIHTLSFYHKFKSSTEHAFGINGYFFELLTYPTFFLGIILNRVLFFKSIKLGFRLNLKGTIVLKVPK